MRFEVPLCGRHEFAARQRAHVRFPLSVRSNMVHQAGHALVVPIAHRALENLGMFSNVIIQIVGQRELAIAFRIDTFEVVFRGIQKRELLTDRQCPFGFHLVMLMVFLLSIGNGRREV